MGEVVDISTLGTREGCHAAINRLIEMPAEDIALQDIAVLNLLCAPELPGSDDLNVPRCLGRLAHATRFVGEGIARNREWLERHETYESEPMERMGFLVTKLKRDYGAAYSPPAAADLAEGINVPYLDSSEVFVHGLLRDDSKRRRGTCTSIPVLITAVARLLGYPVRLAVTRRHLYCRWDDGAGTCFNIEASNPMGMSVLADEHYRNFPDPMTVKEQCSGFYLRSLTGGEEFGLFLRQRAQCLRDAGHYDETLRFMARALQLCPDDPNFHIDAYNILDWAIKHRHWKRFPEKPLPSCTNPSQPYFKIADFLQPIEWPYFFTVEGHHREKRGDVKDARDFFEDACRFRPQSVNEHRDLRRFLRKHDLGRKKRPILPPKNGKRFFKLRCQPPEEYDFLRRLAGDFERRGELLKARDALQDLYMFDPSDGEVFERMRSLENNPWCRAQLDAQLANCRNVHQQSKKMFAKFNERIFQAPIQNGPLNVNVSRKERLACPSVLH